MLKSKRNLFGVLLNTYILIIFSTFILIAFAPVIFEEIVFIFNWFGGTFFEKEFEEVVEVIDGLATILVGYGVVLEERETIMNLSGRVYFGERAFKEKHLNEQSHIYGMGLLIFGLLLEIVTQSIKLPHRILDTSNILGYLLIICLVFTSVSLWLLFSLTIQFIISLPFFKSNYVTNPEE